MDTALTTELREAYGTGKARRFVLRESECEGFNPLKLRIRMFGSFGITVLAAPNDVVIALANATAFVFKWELLWKGFDDNGNEDEDISKFSIGWIQITEHRKRKAKCAFYIYFVIYLASGLLLLCAVTCLTRSDFYLICKYSAFQPRSFVVFPS